MCLYPKLYDNPKYRVNKKNGGNVPVLKDSRVGKVPVGCKKCIECRKQKAQEWRVRLLEEYRSDQEAIFVTLTFSNESIRKLARKVKKELGNLPEGYEFDNAIASKAVRYFCENWRKQNGGKSVKHWLITELGHEGTENIHLHGVVWSKDTEAIKRAWKRGWIYFGYSFNEKGINYFTKYVNKVDKDHEEYVSKIFCSAGIGKGYLDRYDSLKNKYKFGGTNEVYVNRQGFKMALPKYFRNKLYTEEEREKLWIEKLDSGLRFVLGTEIDVMSEHGREEYYRMLEEARRKNKRLGYGNDEINWSKVEYENARREVQNKRRIDDEIIDFDPDTGELL